MLSELCAQAGRVLDQFTPQGLSNVAWGLGRLEHHDPALMDGIAQAALRALPGFTAQELALLASGFAREPLGLPCAAALLLLR